MWLIMSMGTLPAYALDAAVYRQLQEHAVDVQVSEVRSEGPEACGPISRRVVPALIFIVIVAYIFIHRSLHESVSLLEVE
jgi:hypothetical protein